MKRLVIIASHPIQYYAPWFRFLHQQKDLQVEVLYLWNTIAAEYKDKDFDRSLLWDVDLLEGYSSRFIQNRSPNPGTHYWGGLDNPTLLKEVVQLRPTVVLMTTLFNKSPLHFALRWNRTLAPLLFRGDSHLIGQEFNVASPKALFKRLLFSRLNAVLPVGKANSDYFSAHGVSQNKQFFVPHAIDSARFLVAKPTAEIEAAAWRSRLGISKDAFVFLFVGKYIQKKRPDLLLAAYKEFISRLSLEEHQRVALIFCGSGEMEAELKSKASSLPGVHFLGFQNQQIMPTVYCLANLLVLPSQGPSETWGLCVNEAMTLGRPALVSSHVGCQRDLVEDKITGLVFRARDVLALAKELEWSYHNQSNVIQFSVSAEKRIQGYNYEAATYGLQLALQQTTSLRNGFFT